MVPTVLLVYFLGVTAAVVCNHCYDYYLNYNDYECSFWYCLPISHLLIFHLLLVHLQTFLPCSFHLVLWRDM